MAFVIPVLKGGDKKLLCNYRPITILNAFAKIFENIVTEHLHFHLKHKLYPNQHGFTPGRSALTNLVQLSNFVQGHVKSRSQCDVIYIDLSKAFDTVDHELLIGKLGLFPIYIKWFHNYLTNRTFKVKIGNTVSNLSKINNGIPQGSPLGPLLFNIFINDLCPLVTNSMLLLYADDIKIIKDVNSNIDNVIL